MDDDRSDKGNNELVHVRSDGYYSRVTYTSSDTLSDFNFRSVETSR